MSSLKINYQKSEVLTLGINEHQQERIVDVLPIKQGTFL